MIRKKILVVDDERKIRDLYQRLLIDDGYAAVGAADAEEAKGMLLKEDFDLVLLDIRMPGTDGVELYRVIKEYAPKLRVIISSVTPLEEQRKVIAGASDYYEKAAETEQLLAKVKKILEIG